MVIGNLDIIRQLILPQIAALRLMLNIDIVFVQHWFICGTQKYYDKVSLHLVVGKTGFWIFETQFTRILILKFGRACLLGQLCPSILTLLNCDNPVTNLKIYLP